MAEAGCVEGPWNMTTLRHTRPEAHPPSQGFSFCGSRHQCQEPGRPPRAWLCQLPHPEAVNLACARPGASRISAGRCVLAVTWGAAWVMGTQGPVSSCYQPSPAGPRAAVPASPASSLPPAPLPMGALHLWVPVLLSEPHGYGSCPPRIHRDYS